MEYYFAEFESVGRVIGVAVLVVLVGLLLMLAEKRRRGRIVRRRLECPVKRQDAIVEFFVDSRNGETYRDVAACSLFAPREPIDCGKTCRSTSTAPFGKPVPGASRSRDAS